MNARACRSCRCGVWLGVAASLLLAGGIGHSGEKVVRPRAPVLAITSGALTGSVEGDHVHARCTFRLRSTGTGWQNALLVSGGMRPARIEADRHVVVSRSAEGLTAAVRRPGTFAVRVDFSLPVVRRGDERHVVLPAPQGAEQTVRIRVPGERVQAACDKPHAVRTTYRQTHTEIEILVQSRAPLRLRLAPETRRTDHAPRVVVRLDGELHVGEGAIRLTATAACRLLDGAGRRLHLILPPGWAPLELTGSDLQGWRPVARTYASDKPNRLALTRSTAREQFTLTLVCTRALDVEAERVRVVLPRLAEATQTAGSLQLQSAADLRVRVLSVTGGHAASREGLPAVSVTKPGATATLEMLKEPFRFDAELAERVEVWEHGLVLRGRLAVRVRSGGTSRLSCVLTPGLRVLALTGPQVRQWHQKGDRLTIDTARPVREACTMQFEADLSRGETPWPAPVMRPEGAGRVRYTLAFQPQKGTDLIRRGEPPGLEQVDVGELADWLKPASAALSGDQPPTGLRLDLEPIPPTVWAAALSEVEVGESALHQRIFVAVRVRRAAIFQHRLQLETDLAIQEVEAAAVKDWNYNPRTGLLSIQLEEALRADARVYVRATRELADTVRALDLRLPVVLDATRFRGGLAVHPGRGWHLTAGEAEAVVEAGMEDMRLGEAWPHLQRRMHKPHERSRTAAKLPPPLSRPPRPAERFFVYRESAEVLPLSRQRIQPVLRVDEDLVVTVSRGRVQLAGTLSFELKRGGVGALSFALPRGFRLTRLAPVASDQAEAAFRAEHVREEGECVTVTFPSRRYDLPPVRLLCEKPTPMHGGAAAVQLEPIRVMDASRVAGELLVVKRIDAAGHSDLEIQEAGQSRFLRRPLPAAETPERQPVLAYRFHSAAAKLTLEATSVTSGARRAARATDCRLVSRITRDGKLLTKLSCQVQNPGTQQFLDVELPRGAQLWSTYARSTGTALPIKPVYDQAEGRLLVPLTGFNITAKDFRLDIVYIQALERSFGYASLDLQSPTLRDIADARGGQSNMRVEQMGWELYLPERYDLVHHSGNLLLRQGRQSLSSRLITLVWELLAALWALVWMILGVLWALLVWVFKAAFVLLLVGGALFLAWRAVQHLARRDRARVRWRGALQVVGALVILGIVAGLLLPVTQKAREAARRANSSSNLRQIGLSIQMYASEQYYGTMPTSLQDLYQGGAGLISDDKIFEIPGAAGRYGYVAEAGDTGPEDEIIAFELREGGPADHALALYRDSHVAWLPNDKIVENLRRHGNTQALTAFTDNWQQLRYQKRKTDSWFTFGKDKVLASLKSEAYSRQKATKRNVQRIETQFELQQEEVPWGGETSLPQAQPQSAAEREKAEAAYRRELQKKRKEQKAQAASQLALQRSLERSHAHRGSRRGKIGQWLNEKLEAGKEEKRAKADGREVSARVDVQVQTEIVDELAPTAPAAAEPSVDLETRPAPPPPPPEEKPAERKPEPIARPAPQPESREEEARKKTGERAHTPTPDAEADGIGATAGRIPPVDKKAPDWPAGQAGPGKDRAGRRRAQARGTALGRGMQAGTLPIEVHMTDLRQGQRFYFARDTASSAVGEVRLFCLSSGLSLALEVLVALALVLGLREVNHRWPGLGLPVSFGLLVLVSLMRLWTGPAFRPQLILATVVLVGLILLALPGLARRLRARVRSA